MKTNTITAVFPEMVFSGDISYKRSPGFINTYVSEAGDVVLLNSYNELIKAKVVEWSTVKGTYKYASLINDNFIPVKKAIHQLVCFTYHGNPPTDAIYEPNHIDGDKHNNSKDNLEWVTRKKNVQLAYDTGLCETGIRIKATNVTNGVILNYNSLSKMSREWNIPRHTLRLLISKHTMLPYKNEWLFNIDDSRDSTIERHQTSSVIAKDYLTGIITQYNSITDAGLKTNINSGTIALRTRNNDTSLLSKYVFMRGTDVIIWPSYSKEDALMEEKKYNKCDYK